MCGAAPAHVLSRCSGLTDRSGRILTAGTEERVDDVAEVTRLGDVLSLPVRTYSTGMRIRLALDVVTSIDPEIPLRDERIGAVDSAFLRRTRGRLADLVDLPGMLVSAVRGDLDPVPHAPGGPGP